ncbi:unnamed protein product [Calypogeia fissa]
MNTAGRPRLGSQKGTPAARTPPLASRVSSSRTPPASHPRTSNPRTPSASSPLPHEYTTPASEQSSDMSSGIEEEDEFDAAAADSGSIATVLLEAPAWLRNGGHTQQPALGLPEAALSQRNKEPFTIPPEEIAVTPPNKRRLRPRQTGLSLKEPDFDISDVEDYPAQPKPRSGNMAMIRGAKSSVKRQQSHSKCRLEVATSVSKKKGKSCYCRVQSTRCADCRATGKTSPGKEYGAANEGQDYHILEGKVVCKVPPCKNRIFKTWRTFGNHVFKKHGLISKDTSLTVYALDSDEEEKRPERNARRRVQPGQSLCYNYYGARGSMRKRWSQAKYRMRAAIWKRFVTMFEENALKNPRPVLGLEPLFITLLRHMMPSLGLSVWESLADDSNYSRVVDIVSEAKTNPRMGEWATKMSKDVLAGVFRHLSQQELKILTAAAYVGQAVFGEDTESRHAKAVKRVLTETRESVVELALQWLSIQRANVTKENGWSVYEMQAKAHYAAWKHQSREKSCATTMPNLVKAYKLFKGCSEAEAVVQVRSLPRRSYIFCNHMDETCAILFVNVMHTLTWACMCEVQVLADSEWFDTSDEEDVPEEAPAPSHVEVHGEKGKKSPSTKSPTKSQADKGLEFSADSEALDDEAEEIDPPTPALMPNNNSSREDCHGGQVDYNNNSDITAVMGLFNLSQNLAFQLPASPPNLGVHEDMVLPAFDASLGLEFDSPPVPQSILSS